MPDSPANKILKIITALLLLFIAINLLILDIKIFSEKKDTAASIVDTQTTPKDSMNLKTTVEDKDEATNAASLSNPTPVQQVIIQTSVPTSEGVQEFYVPLGSDTTSNTQYTTLPSTQSLIDTGSYGNITQAYFIGGLSNPTGNGFVQAQLYDVTNQHPVWGSTITLSSGVPGPQTIISNPITLDPGANQYAVQLMSTLGYPGYIDNAKVRILAQ